MNILKIPVDKKSQKELCLRQESETGLWGFNFWTK